MYSKFRGTGVAMVTPFKDNGDIDFDSLKKLIERLIIKNVDYLVVLGTTGEAATLSAQEKKEVTEFVIKEVNRRLPIVLGVGGNNTAQVIEELKNLDSKVDAILSVTPYYNKPGQAGIYEHYKTIATQSPVPVIMYNVPGRTAVNIEAETTLRLATEFDKIVGIKEASGNMQQIMHILKNKSKNFLVISGDDALTLPIISLGGSGVISVTANAFPALYSSMVRDAFDGDYRQARKTHYNLLDFIDALFEEGSPAGVKAALKYLDYMPENLRLPLTQVTEEHKLKIYELVRKIKAI